MMLDHTHDDPVSMVGSPMSRRLMVLCLFGMLMVGITIITSPLNAEPEKKPQADIIPFGSVAPKPLEQAVFAQVEKAPADKGPKNIEVPPPMKLPNDKEQLLPSPRVSPFGPDKIRMPHLEPGAIGATPRPTDEDLKEFGQFVEGVVDPRNVLTFVQGRTRLILLKETPTQIQIADDAIAGYNLLNPKQLTVLGRKTGTTVLTLWFLDPKDRTKEKVLSYLLKVIPDPEEKERLERTYKALEKEINRAFPDSRVALSLVGDKLIVNGQAKDVAEATQILRVVRANAPADTAQRIPVNTINLDVRANDLTNPNGTPGLDRFLTPGGQTIINMLRIPGEQQVMLRVTVAEVNRSAARTIGLNFNILRQNGQTVFGQQTGGISITGGVNATSSNVGGAVSANLPVLLDNGQIPIAITALKTLNYARSLAEPNLVTMNGQPANFRAGGEFPVPVLGGVGQTSGSGSGLQGVQFVPYGVQLSFTPVITDRDRVRLMVNAQVSTRDNSQSANIGGTSVPGLNSRTFSTTVEMREGQTLAVAGLIQTNIASSANRVPFFGEIPILNRLASLDSNQAAEQELVILITPELVHPLERKEIPKLPGSDLFEPSDLEFFLLGRLESRRPEDYRSPVKNEIHRMIQYHRCEKKYIFGPIGHTDDPNYPIP